LAQAQRCPAGAMAAIAELQGQLERSQEQLETLMQAFQTEQQAHQEAAQALDAEKYAHQQTKIELEACKAMLARGPEKTGNGGEGGSSTLQEQLTACKVELDVAHEVERTLTEHYAKSLRDNSLLEQRVKEMEQQFRESGASPDRRTEFRPPQPAVETAPQEIAAVSPIPRPLTVPHVPRAAGKREDGLVAEVRTSPVLAASVPGPSVVPAPVEAPRPVTRGTSPPAALKSPALPQHVTVPLPADMRTVVRLTSPRPVERGPTPAVMARDPPKPAVIRRGPPPSPSTGANYRYWAAQSTARVRSPSPTLVSPYPVAPARSVSPVPSLTVLGGRSYSSQGLRREPAPSPRTVGGWDARNMTPRRPGPVAPRAQPVQQRPSASPPVMERAYDPMHDPRYPGL